MAYPTKVDSALAVLAGTGMSSSNYAPPIHRILWRMGTEIPPPHLASFGFNVLLSGLWFGAIWGLFMWFFTWRASGMTMGAASLAALGAGIVFGIAMASFYRYGSRKYKLPSWSQFERSL